MAVAAPLFAAAHHGRYRPGDRSPDRIANNLNPLAQSEFTPSIYTTLTDATPHRRIRYLSDDEERRLLATLPAHLADVARFALATGLRMANITKLEWRQVDLGRRQAWIWADQSKTREALAVPLNEDAVNVLRGQWGQHTERVFTHQGKPFHQANGRTWRTAVKAAGLADFRFHDLRHTWATRHIQAGTPLHALMELGGWQSPEMVRKYAHFSASHLQQFAENTTRRAESGTNPAQRQADVM